MHEQLGGHRVLTLDLLTTDSVTWVKGLGIMFRGLAAPLAQSLRNCPTQKLITHRHFVPHFVHWPWKGKARQPSEFTHTANMDYLKPLSVEGCADKLHRLHLHVSGKRWAVIRLKRASCVSVAVVLFLYHSKTVS
jgi:hypothetical protein